MSNTSSKNNNAANQTKSTDNKAITDVEVIKDEKVVFEDGDFEEYNAENNYQEGTNEGASKNDKSEFGRLFIFVEVME